MNTGLSVFFGGPSSWVPGPAHTGRPGMTSGWIPLPFYVYLLASRRHGTLYPGVTNDLMRRVHQHKTGDIPGFTSRYDVSRLVVVRTPTIVRPTQLLVRRR